MVKYLQINKSALAPLWSVTFNILWVYVIFSLLRVEYLLENLSYFKPSIEDGNLWHLFWSGIILDTPGIFYVNVLYIALMLFPLHLKERPGYYRFCHILFVVLNSIAVLANLADSVYFSYTLRRSTWDIFSEFSHDNNLSKITEVELLRHWYLVLTAAILIYGLWKVYLTPRPGADTKPLWRYYLLSILSLSAGILTAIGGIRGGFLNHWAYYLIAFPLAYIAFSLLRGRQSRSLWSKAAGLGCGCAALALLIAAPIGGWRHRDIRPISIASAGKYVSRPIESALVLNTPFSMIRTIGASTFRDPGYFSDAAELKSIYTPVHLPAGDLTVSSDSIANKKNVVIIILESFGKEYFGSLNKEILGKEYKGYTPFLDSLVSVSATWRHSFDNGRKSIDAMPSILAGIPQFEKPFVLTPAALNRIEGIPAVLAKEGYSSAFFHGARTGSMGFDSFARSIGFQKYFGREDFVADGRAGGSEEFDGYWGIWDEPFLQYFALKLSEMREPFVSALFTVSSHHPFNIPDKYNGRWPKDDEMPIYRTISYVDNALREFFASARRQPWFRNTVFVITNDHTNARAHDEYKSDIGAFSGPVIIYDPSGSITPGMREGIAQQTDIMPTVLAITGASAGYVAFGDNLLSTPAEDTWAVNWINNIYQYVKYGYVMQFDGEKPLAIYAVDDFRMQNNILGKDPATERKMERELKAIIQQYMQRMSSDRLIYAP